MEEGKRIARYEQAAALLPSRIRPAALAVEDWKKCRTEEFRLRAGRAASILTAEGELFFSSGAPVAQEELEHMVNLLTDGSRYACGETLRRGYLPLRGGFRLGLCGSAVIREGECSTLRDFSSLCLRIPREYRGIAAEVTDRLFSEGRFQSTLVLSPPGGGKTTLLRDLIRCISLGGDDRGALRIGVVDERGELAATVKGTAQMDLGPRTDVLDGMPKAAGVELLMRVMNPQLIAVDEITAGEDAVQLLRAANCGVGLLATMHAGNLEELRGKEIFKALAAAKVFSRVIEIRRVRGERVYAVEEFG